MKTMMTVDMWREVEQILIKNDVGYKVDIDNHHGIPEMVIHIDSIGVMRTDIVEVNNEL